MATTRAPQAAVLEGFRRYCIRISASIRERGSREKRSACDLAEGGLNAGGSARSGARVHDAFARGLRERDGRGGDWSFGSSDVASGDSGACLLDGGAQRAADGLVALGANQALTITFLCGRVIGHASENLRGIGSGLAPKRQAFTLRASGALGS
jgi:hypothetical protein